MVTAAVTNTWVEQRAANRELIDTGSNKRSVGVVPEDSSQNPTTWASRLTVDGPTTTKAKVKRGLGDEGKCLCFS
jgi:hypothetical protein